MSTVRLNHAVAVAARPFRYPRSPVDSPAYQPDWRDLQVAQYRGLNAKLERGEPGGRAGVPDDEDDDLVLDLYGWERHGSCNDVRRERAFFYAREAQAHNARTGAASRLRAFAVAGLSPDAMARRFGTNIQNIRTFLQIYFDVGPYLANRDFVSSLVFPFTVAKGEDVAATKERLWLCAAFVLGPEGLDRFLLRPVDANPARVDETVALVRAFLSQDALTLLVGRHAAALPVYEDFDRLVAFNQTPQEIDREAEGKEQAFNFGMAQLLARNTEGLPGHHPVRQIVEVATQMSAPAKAGFAPRRALPFGASSGLGDPLLLTSSPTFRRPPSSAVLDSLDV